MDRGTLTVLRGWLDEHHGKPGDPLFPTRRGGPLSRDAIEHRIAHYAAQAAACPSLRARPISAHGSGTPPRCGSCTDHGVLVPIVAHRTADGELHVLYGARRTLAAVEASTRCRPGDNRARRRGVEEGMRRTVLATAAATVTVFGGLVGVTTLALADGAGGAPSSTPAASPRAPLPVPPLATRLSVPPLATPLPVPPLATPLPVPPLATPLPLPPQVPLPTPSPTPR